MTKIKSLSTLCLLAAALLLPLCGRAQTNVQATLGDKISGVFGLYNTNLDTFSSSSTFGVNTGARYRSVVGTWQEIEAFYAQRIGATNADTSANWIRPEVNIDTLGQANGGLDGFGVHVAFEHTKHNLGGLIGLGYQRDEDRKSDAFELEIGVEAFVTQNVGIFAKGEIGKELDGPKNVYNAIKAGATWKF
jgi:hypothetical protein